MNTKTVICAYCHKEFQRRVCKANEAAKGGYNQFCSKECQSKFKTKKEIRNCANCGKEIERIPADIKKTKYGWSFCSLSCKSQYYGPSKTVSEEQKIKISKGLGIFHEKHGSKRKIRQCIICDKPFLPCHKSQKCCSLSCGLVKKHGALPYTKEEVERKILELAKKENRTPIQTTTEKRLLTAAIRIFGSWGKTMIHLGLEPNPLYMNHRKKKLYAKDGHRADSIAELTIDNWLANNNIKHEKNKLYGMGQTTCDFYLPDYDVWVEYFGLMNKSDYRERVIKKKEFAKQKGYKLIEIYPKDLYPYVKLNDLLGDFVETII